MKRIWEKWTIKNPYTSVEYYYECINQTKNQEILHFVWYVDMEIRNKMYQKNLENYVYFYDITKKKSKNSKKIISSIARRNNRFLKPIHKNEATINSLFIHVAGIEYKIKIDFMPNEQHRKMIIYNIYDFLEENFKKIIDWKFSKKDINKIVFDIFKKCI